jgi:hypothetical protein
MSRSEGRRGGNVSPHLTPQSDAETDTESVQLSSALLDLQSVSTSPKTPPTAHRRQNIDFVDPSYPESRLLHGSTPHDEELEELDTFLSQGRPWIEDDGTPRRANLRIQLFQALVENCDRLDQKYSLSSPNSCASTRDLFVAHPWLVRELENCWENGSFITIYRLGDYPGILRDPI